MQNKTQRLVLEAVVVNQVRNHSEDLVTNNIRSEKERRNLEMTPRLLIWVTGKWRCNSLRDEKQILVGHRESLDVWM